MGVRLLSVECTVVELGCQGGGRGGVLSHSTSREEVLKLKQYYHKQYRTETPTTG